MVPVLNAKEFYKEFLLNTKEDTLLVNAANLGIEDTTLENKTYMDIYRNHEKAYTKLVNKRIIHEIIENAVDEEGTPLVPQHEYFRIDNIGYKHKYYKITEEERDDIGLWRHLWDLKIAVEHENSKKDWMDEVVKLIHIRCPLKVVVAYNNCDMRDDGDIKKLDFIAKWVPEVDAFDKNAKEEFLIIIGNGAPKHKANPNYTKFDYRGYLYNASLGKFERIYV